MAKKNLLFGIRPIEEALEAGKDIDKIMVSRDFGGSSLADLRKLAVSRGVYLQTVPKEKLNRLTNANHQGVVAFASPITFHDIEILLPTLFEQGKTPLFIALDGVTDVRNFGALSRSAECAGLHGIIISQRGSAPVTPDAIKTSAGALLKLPVSKTANLFKTLRYLQNSGLQVVAITEKGDSTIYDIDYLLPTVFVLGGEDTGISSQVLKIADKIAKIPMRGTINSLNVSVAGALAMFEASKQRYLK